MRCTLGEYNACMARAVTNARRLRRRLTDAERALWRNLRDRQLDGHKFRRQHPLGRFVVDFVCLEERLVVELDGGQHALRKNADTARTAWLNREGYRVLRFWNNEVLRNTDGVLAEILRTLQDQA